MKLTFFFLLFLSFVAGKFKCFFEKNFPTKPKLPPTDTHR